jgi:hypothetical protein
MAIQTAVAQCDATARTTPGSHGWEFTRCCPNDDSLSSRGAVSSEIAQRDV